MNLKYFFTISFLMMLFVFKIQPVSADVCSDKHPTWSCKDVTTLSNPECVTGLCPGAANIQCCNPISISLNNGTTNTAKSSGGSYQSSGSTNFTNPLGNINTVEAFLGNIMVAVQRIIVTLALITITIGALMYVTSFGGKQIEKAKEAITAALVGLALAIAAPSMLKELANVLGWGGSVPAALTLSEIAIRVLNFLLGIFGIVSLIMMIIGASLYLTSAGDKDRIGKGKDIFKYSILGVVIAMSSMILIRQIAAFFIG